MKGKFFGLLKKFQNFFYRKIKNNRLDGFFQKDNTLVYLKNYPEDEFKPVDLSVIIDEMNDTSYDLKERYEYFQKYLNEKEEEIEYVSPEVERNMYPDMPHIVDLGLFRHIKTFFPSVMRQLFPEINNEEIHDYLNEGISLLPMILKNRKDSSYNDCMAYILTYFNLFLKFNRKREPARKYLYFSLCEEQNDYDNLTRQTIENVLYFKIMLDQNYFVNNKP